MKSLFTPAAATGDHVPRTKKSSAKEFLLTKNPKTDTQRLLALGYFLEYMSGMDSFNINDLESAFRAAKEKPPGNINDVVNKNIARGFLMDVAIRKDSKKAWCLTSTGEQYLLSNFSK